MIPGTKNAPIEEPPHSPKPDGPVLHFAVALGGECGQGRRPGHGGRAAPRPSARPAADRRAYHGAPGAHSRGAAGDCGACEGHAGMRVLEWDGVMSRYARAFASQGAEVWQPPQTRQDYALTWKGEETWWSAATLTY